MGQGDSFKEKRALKKSEEEMKKMIIQSIINTNSNIQAAQKNYEFAEGELIDYYLYTIKAKSYDQASIPNYSAETTITIQITK